MRFVRWVFGLAAAYGLAATVSQYFRAPLGLDTIWLFAFAGAAAATQLLYVALAINPQRYRPLIPIGIVSKLSFAAPIVILEARGEAGFFFEAALIDLGLALLFALCWWRCGSARPRAAPAPARPRPAASR